MNTFEIQKGFELNKHIRILTYRSYKKGNQQDRDDLDQKKIKALDAILATSLINDKTVSAVLTSLDDRSENDSLRKHGVKTIHSMLEKASLPEQKDCIMRHLMTRIFGRYYDKTVVGHKELLRTLVSTIKHNIDDMDHLFVWLMQEVNKVQEINYNSTELPNQVAKFFETEHQKDNLRSKEIFQSISNERHLFALYDNTTPLNTLQPTLEFLGKRNIKNIDFDLIAAHLSPVLNYRSSRKEKYDNGESITTNQIVRLALDNIEKWAKEFPNTVEEISAQRNAIYNWYHNPTEYTLDDITLKQLGMNTIFVPELVAALTKQRKTVCDTAQLFKVLSYFNNIRRWNNDCEYIRNISNFILDAKHEKPKSNFPYVAAIDFLKKQLTGLDVYQPTSQEAENETQGERYRRRLLIERNLRADGIIKQTLLTLSQNTNLSNEVRSKTWSVIISAMPSDLLEMLHDNIKQLQTNEEILNSALKDLSCIHSPATYPILENLWHQRQQFDFTTKKQISITLGAVGSYDIVPLLLPTVFDDENGELRQAVKEVLINQGYDAEVEKEAHKRKILALHSREKAVSKSITEHEKKIKSLYQLIRKSQVDYNETSQKLSVAVNDLDTFTIGKKLELADTAVDLAKIKGKIKILLKKVGELEAEVRELTKRLNRKVNEAENVLSQVRQIESDITRKDRELTKARTNLQNARNTLKKLQSDERISSRLLSDLESQLSQANRQLSPLKSNVQRLKNELSNIESDIRRLEAQARREVTDNPNNFNRYNSQISSLRTRKQGLQRQRTQASNSLTQQNNEVNRLGRLVNSERSKLSSIRNEIGNTNRNIQYYQDAIPRLESDIKRLQAKHETLNNRINEINSDIDKYRNKIARHTDIISQLKSEISILQSELNAVIRLQQAISESSDIGIRERSTVVERWRNEANRATEKLNELNIEFTDTENKLQHFKTEKQTLMQQIEFERGHYDGLGDKCNVQSNEANVRNENRSQSKKDLNKGNDEIRLAKDRIIGRSVDEFSNRNPSTNKIIKKIQN